MDSAPQEAPVAKIETTPRGKNGSAPENPTRVSSSIADVNTPELRGSPVRTSHQETAAKSTSSQARPTKPIKVLWFLDKENRRACELENLLLARELPRSSMDGREVVLKSQVFQKQIGALSSGIYLAVQLGWRSGSCTDTTNIDLAAIHMG